MSSLAGGCPLCTCQPLGVSSFDPPKKMLLSAVFTPSTVVGCPPTLDQSRAELAARLPSISKPPAVTACARCSPSTPSIAKSASSMHSTVIRRVREFVMTKLLLLRGSGGMPVRPAPSEERQGDGLVAGGHVAGKVGDVDGVRRERERLRRAGARTAQVRCERVRDRELIGADAEGATRRTTAVVRFVRRRDYDTARRGQARNSDL